MFGYTQRPCKAQPTLRPTLVTLEKRKNPRNSKTVLLDSRVYGTPGPQLAPTLSERDLMILWEFRRGNRACNEGYCKCACKCHSGPECQGDMPRIHTPGHKPQQVLVRRDIDCPDCPWNGTNHHHTLTCRDANTETRFHQRRPNTSHKRAHRECPKEGREHNRK